MSVDFAEATEGLRRLYVLKEDIGDISDPKARASRAASMVVSGLRVIREALGKDLLREAYGELTDDTTRDTLLMVIAGRLEIASWLFLDFDGEPGGLSQVAAEARAVAHGDAPDLFARLPGRRSAHRLYGAKLEAHRWDAWLEGFGISVAERHAAIADAYGEACWDTIFRWRDPLCRRWGNNRISERLGRDKSDGSRLLRMWIMNAAETWQDALRRCGGRYQLIKRRHAELSE